MTKQEEQAVRERLAKLENAVGPLMHRVGDLATALDALGQQVAQLEARLEVRIRQHDATIQMHCDNALALRQISGALEDLVRRAPR
jgi:predicted  nucleic acid-binding Zn-ribbon protein